MNRSSSGSQNKDSGHSVFKKQIELSLTTCSCDPREMAESRGVMALRLWRGLDGVRFEGLKHQAKAVLAWRLRGDALL